VRDFAVPAPGVEMASQVLDITRRMRADWVVGHLFGNALGVHQGTQEERLSTRPRSSAWYGELARKT